MSAADLMAVLLAKYLRYDFDQPDDPRNDHLIFSKGHASPLLYSIYKAAGAVTDEELLTFRKLGSRLEGHPTPKIPWVDVATGSLGQGLPIAVGVALAGKKLDRLPYHVWCLCGDSELAEGSMWEAFEHAAFAGLDNLIAILDINRLGQRGETMHGWDLSSYTRRIEACGWAAIEIDGHDVDAIDRAYEEALSTTGRPTAIVARTIKGKRREGGREPGRLARQGARRSGRGDRGARRRAEHRRRRPQARGRRAAARVRDRRARAADVRGRRARWRRARPTATRCSRSARRAATSSRSTARSRTRPTPTSSRRRSPSGTSRCTSPSSSCVAAAVGLQVRGWKPFASTFAAFLSRAYDFVRMAAISQADIRLCGSHAGVSIGEDGPSQMALEDLAAFRAVHGSTVLYPSDANQTAKLVAAMADLEGISFMRTTRGATPVIYDAGEDFPVGGAKVVRDGDDVTLVGAGITLHEALKAADALADEGISARVIDLYSLKPIDADTLREAVEATHGRIVVVEDHWPEGGLGEAVLAALAGEELAFEHLAVREMPGSGKPAELLAAAGIDADAIAAAARRLVSSAAVTR